MAQYKKTPVFNALLIPGDLVNGKQQLSIALELNQAHPVLNRTAGDTVTENEINAWKIDVLNLPQLAKSLLERGTGNLPPLLLTSQNIKIYPVGGQLNDLNSAKELWADFLGFETSGGKIEPRKKNKKPGLLPDQQKKFIPSLSAQPKLTIQPHVVVQNVIGAQTVRTNLNTIEQVIEHLKEHPMIRACADTALDQKIAKGIAQAYEANLEMNNSRNNEINELVALYEIEPHKDLSAIQKKMVNSEAFRTVQKIADSYLRAKLLANEPGYIQEAVNKLNAILPVRKYLGTMLNFEYLPPLAAPIPELKLAGHQDFEEFINFDFVTKVTLDIKRNALVPFAVPGYDTYYKYSMPLLQGKARIVSFETEGVQRNLKEATQTIAADGTLKRISIDEQEYKHYLLNSKAVLKGKSADLVAYQDFQIRTEKLNKATLKLQNRIANIQTKGHEVFVNDAAWLAYDPNKDLADNRKELYEHDLTGGFIVYVRVLDGGKVVTDWTSINRLYEYFGKTGKGKERFVATDLAINTDALINSLESAADGTTALNGVNNGFMYNWDGTILSTRNPMRHYEREYEKEADGIAARMQESEEQEKHVSAELLALVKATRGILRQDWFPFNRQLKPARFMLKRRFIFDSDKLGPAAKLKFSDSKVYQYIMMAQYFNGKSHMTQQELRQLSATENLDKFIVEEKFQRHDHIRPLIVSLDEDIYFKQTKNIKPGFWGESNVDLVIRDGDIASNDVCVRYILPPPIPTFQTYLWYDFTGTDKFSKSRLLNKEERLRYFRKSQCELKNEEDFHKSKGCKQQCAGYCHGKEQPPVYDDELLYLSDPVVTGFIVKFFYDEACLISASDVYDDVVCPFGKGDYPQLKPWKIVLKSGKSEQNKVESFEHQQVLEVSVPKGRQLFAEFYPVYNSKTACFAPALLNVSSLAPRGKDQELIFNPLYCSAVRLSFTYAVQKPLFDPVIQHVELSRYMDGSRNSTPGKITAKLNLKFEQLNIWNGVPLPESQPTGELELFMLWNDYSLHQQGPQKSIADKKKPKLPEGGYVYIGKIRFEKPVHNGMSYLKNLKPAESGNEYAISSYFGIVEFESGPSFDLVYHSPSVFKVRNTSKFISCFEPSNTASGAGAHKNDFSRWSAEFDAADEQYFEKLTYQQLPDLWIASSNYLFNNSKPQVPVVEKIVSLIKRDDYEGGTKTDFSERVRVYYHPASSGKDFRLGILINEPQSVYPKYLNDYISKAGRDAVMDNPDDSLDLVNFQLARKNFNIGSAPLEKEYISDFKPKYDSDSETMSSGLIGLVSYIPLYDPQQDLWYVDVELNLNNTSGKQLHSPFVQLGLVNYQPYAANYGMLSATATEAERFDKDYRLSAPVKSDFFAIRPDRKFKNPFVLFKKPKVNKFFISGAVSSLYFKKKELKSEFLLCVQKRGTGDTWEVVMSELLNKEYRLNNVLINEQNTLIESSYHLLLKDLQPAIRDYADSMFECGFQLNFDRILFGHHRVVIYEVECHNDLTLAVVLEKTKVHEPQHIDGLRIINNYIFYK